MNMTTVYITIRVENSFNVEVPDNLTQDEIYDYIMENCQDDIDMAIRGGDFDLDIESMVE